MYTKALIEAKKKSSFCNEIITDLLNEKSVYRRVTKVPPLISLKETEKFPILSKKYIFEHLSSKNTHPKHMYITPLFEKNSEIKGVNILQMSETTLIKKDNEDNQNNCIIVSKSKLLTKKRMELPWDQNYALCAPKSRNYVFSQQNNFESFINYISIAIDSPKEGHILPDFNLALNQFSTGYENYDLLLDGNISNVISSCIIYNPLNVLSYDKNLDERLAEAAITFTNYKTYKKPDLITYQYLAHILERNSIDKNLPNVIRSQNLKILEGVKIVLKYFNPY